MARKTASMEKCISVKMTCVENARLRFEIDNISDKNGEVLKREIEHYA